MKGALVVTVPEAVEIVDETRRALDASYALGLPPHVTVVFPFGLPAEIGVGGVQKLHEVVAELKPTTVQFSSLAWFGREVLWLKPDSGKFFRNMVQAVSRTFPRYPPYEGAHATVVPHLTVGVATSPVEAEVLQAAEAQIARQLPIVVDVRPLTYGAVGDSPGSWRVVHRFAIGDRTLP